MPRLRGGRAQRLVREVEADHGQRPRRVEHDVGGFGVDDDVELGHRAPVPHVEAAAHQHHFASPAQRCAAPCATASAMLVSGPVGTRVIVPGSACHDGLPR